MWPNDVKASRLRPCPQQNWPFCHSSTIASHVSLAQFTRPVLSTAQHIILMLSLCNNPHSSTSHSALWTANTHTLCPINSNTQKHAGAHHKVRRSKQCTKRNLWRNSPKLQNEMASIKIIVRIYGVRCNESILWEVYGIKTSARYSARIEWRVHQKSVESLQITLVNGVSNIL